MSLDVLVDLLLQFDPKRDLFLQLFALLTVLSLQVVKLELEMLFVKLVHLYFLLLLLVLQVQLPLELVGQLGDHHPIVCLAAVFEQDGVHLPDVCQQGVLIGRMRQALVYHLVKPY